MDRSSAQPIHEPTFSPARAPRAPIVPPARDWLPWAGILRFDALKSPLFRSTREDGAAGAVGDVLAVDRLRGRPLWVITTCERPDACRDLVTELGRAARDADTKPVLIVIRDRGESDYGPVGEAIDVEFKDCSYLIETTRRLGSRQFWKPHQLILDLARVLAPPLVFCVQDDIGLVPGWLDRSKEIMCRLDDPDLAVLSLVVVDDDEAGGRWVRFARRELPSARLTQWFDLQAFLATPRFYAALDYKIRPIHPLRWGLNPKKSSGVGRQFTRRLFGRANIYQVHETLAYHGGEPSIMNPEARSIRSLDNRPGSVPTDRSSEG